MTSRAEPTLSVGLMENVPLAAFALIGRYAVGDRNLPPGSYTARASAGGVALVDGSGRRVDAGPEIRLTPGANPDSTFMLREVPIGRSFHWERFRDQTFSGELTITAGEADACTIINRIPLETYLAAVICSEMSPRSPAEFLKAHSVISRSWLLAQLDRKQGRPAAAGDGSGRWTDAGAHRIFDVCADDHCQRYHGTGAVSDGARQVPASTRGQALVYEGSVCDTRFSKCCGGITERFATAWENLDIPYLQPVADCGDPQQRCRPDVSREEDARRFINTDLPACCNLTDRDLLSRILPDFDFETRNFYRWEVLLTQPQLNRTLLEKTGIDFGEIREIVPLARGASGRIYRLRITGTLAAREFGKELEIRRILSPTHLYSSAFIVEPRGDSGDLPESFNLKGAGWGHGVGLCQIGAAGMAAAGRTCREILAHYFRGAELKSLYL